MKYYFIYLTTNLINNKKYIGKHYGELNDDYLGSGKILQWAIQKYGKNNFTREILHISKNKEENNEWEKIFIEKYNAQKDKNFYNIAPGGDGGDLFHILPLDKQKEIRDNQSIRSQGKNNPMYGKHHSEETKQKISKIDKSYTQTKEYRDNMSRLQSGEKNPMYGRHHSEKTKQKISEKNKGKMLGSKNGNAKSISAYADKNMTQLIKHFKTIQEALIWVGTKPTDYSGLRKSMSLNRPYKK